MLRRTVRLAVAGCAVASLTFAGSASTGSTPSAHAQKWNSNPAPFQRFKSPISPTALIGLGRQSARGGPKISTSGGGSPDGVPPYIGMAVPHSVVASAVGSSPSSATNPPGPQGGISAPPPGSISFTADQSAIEQNETSVTVRQTQAVPSNTYLTDTVVGGSNDFRGAFYAPQYGCTLAPGNQCYPAENCPSFSQFSVSFNSGSSLAKNGCLPYVNGTFQPGGDPSLDRDINGNVFYGSLGFDVTAGSGGNGIMIHRSTPELFNPSNPCQNSSETTNPCWTGRVVFVGNTGANPNGGTCDLGYCTFADKEWIAVDRTSGTPYQGDVYIAWNSFATAGANNGQAHILLSRCHPDNLDPTGFSYCTTPITISQPGDNFTGGGSYLTTTRDGHVLVVYANFGTTTALYPIDERIAVIAPGGATVQGYINEAHLTQDGTPDTVPCLPNRDPASNSHYGAPCQDNTGVNNAAGVGFRLPQFFKIDADRTTGANQNNVYTAFEMCTVPQFYPATNGNGEIIYPGNCPKIDVVTSKTHITFTNGGFTNTGVTFNDTTSGSPAQQFMPSVSVDEKSGGVLVAYNTTQDDQFQNMDSVRAIESVNGGTSFIPLQAPNGGAITSNVPYQIAKDPAGYFGQGSPYCPGDGFSQAVGCFGYAPQNGDYLQGLAYFGRLYTHYQGTYLQKAFNPNFKNDYLTFFDGTLPMNQDDNFLNRTVYGS